ncbi:hypothetical protein Nepgr_003827 [Nepenthes gracilis]|uniref:TPX2 C-terminal domain-containing protein n=1 Tax=Nepenthes gracilis TaxID=150966 RepID=A0AAD3S087_NEPGR|nr:hypothetical protein Nepgr_003827 [Nepenthes gracilis]
MEGNIAEPFRLSFQIESMHSGSISFGRFEAESLSWERRSSFSHNRYLEEAEKFSKPGSVTEKAAYFEAHFKKKALLCQVSSEGLAEIGDQVNECDPEKAVTDEANDAKVMFYTEEYELVDEIHGDALYNESPVSSKCHGDSQGAVFELEVVGSTHSESQKESALDNVDLENNVDPMENFAECNYSEEAHHTDSGSHNSAVVHDEHDFEVEHSSDEGVDVLKGTTQTLGGRALDTSLENLRNGAPKEKAREEIRISELGSKSHYISQSSRTEAVTGTSSKEQQMPSRMRSGEKLPRSTIPSSRTSQLLLKPESPEGSKPKCLDQDKSEKELKAKKAVELPTSTPGRTELRMHQSSNRIKHIVTSSKKENKLNAMTSNYRTGEIAEKGREENSAVQIRQFRRSLNFKAKPLPSFYHEVVPRVSNRHKAMPNSGKSIKVQNNLSCLTMSGTAAFSKVDSKKAISTCKSTKIAELPRALRGQDYDMPETSISHVISAARSTSGNHVPKVGLKTWVIGKNEREKVTGLQYHLVGGGGKTTKAQKSEARQRVGIGRKGSEMLVFTSPAEVVGDAGGVTVFMQLLCQLLSISCQKLIQLVLLGTVKHNAEKAAVRIVSAFTDMLQMLSSRK